MTVESMLDIRLYAKSDAQADGVVRKIREVLQQAREDGVDGQILREVREWREHA